MPVGVFPSGYEIRQTVESASPAQARAERRTSGRRLVADTRLRLTPRAWAALTAGDVDPGLTGLLEQVVQNHTVDVTAFRRTAAERAAGAPARAMLVTAVDGQLVADRGDVAAMGAALFGALGELAPDSLTVRTEPAPAGLLVRVLLPSSMP